MTMEQQSPHDVVQSTFCEAYGELLRDIKNPSVLVGFLYSMKLISREEKRAATAPGLSKDERACAVLNDVEDFLARSNDPLKGMECFCTALERCNEPKLGSILARMRTQVGLPNASNHMTEEAPSDIGLADTSNHTTEDVHLPSDFGSPNASYHMTEEAPSDIGLADTSNHMMEDVHLYVPSDSEYFEKAIQLVKETLCNIPKYQVPLKQIITVPIRQIMNQSVQQEARILLPVIFKIVTMMRNGKYVDKRTVNWILYELPKVNALSRAAGVSIRESQKFVVKEAGEEVIGSAAKAGTSQTAVKLTAKVAAKQAGKSALLMGGLVDGGLLAVYTYIDYSNEHLTKEEFKKRFVSNATSAIGSATMGAAGAATGAAIGTTVFPGVGTAIGAVVGNVIGGIAGSVAGKKITQ